MKKVLISDFTIKEVPHGGSEWVNQVLIDEFNLDFEYSHNVTSFLKDNLYIISNISLMNPKLVREIPNLNYIIIENDYKICQSRHPWVWSNSIIPNNERINYDLYKNAKAVFVQTTDHLNVYRINQVNGNFINLHSSIWADDDLNLLEKLLVKNNVKNGLYGVYDTSNYIKNTNGSINFCKDNNLPIKLIPNMNTREDFLQELSECYGLVFLPIARETFCRLVVEAKCLGLNVITTKNYGASLEGWFELEGIELINFLRRETKRNIRKIKEYIKI